MSINRVVTLTSRESPSNSSRLRLKILMMLDLGPAYPRAFPMSSAMNHSSPPCSMTANCVPSNSSCRTISATMLTSVGFWLLASTPARDCSLVPGDAGEIHNCLSRGEEKRPDAGVSRGWIPGTLVFSRSSQGPISGPSRTAPGAERYTAQQTPGWDRSRSGLGNADSKPLCWPPPSWDSAGSGPGAAARSYASPPL